MLRKQKTTKVTTTPTKNGQFVRLAARSSIFVFHTSLQGANARLQHSTLCRILAILHIYGLPSKPSTLPSSSAQCQLHSLTLSKSSMSSTTTITMFRSTRRNRRLMITAIAEVLLPRKSSHPLKSLDVGILNTATSTFTNIIESTERQTHIRIHLQQFERTFS
jgi:hypothetical protein